MTTPALPHLAVISAGLMSAGVASRLTKAGCTVYTDLTGRSEATRRRAKEAGMINMPLADIVVRAKWILSIVPPADAELVAEKVRDAVAAWGGCVENGLPVFADCNAVNPKTVKRIAEIFAGTGIKFIDGCICGAPPSHGYDPTIYGSAAAEDERILDEFATLSKYGLRVSLLKGEGMGVGDASALKMTYGGITKGTTAVYTTMILAAHAASPATAAALMKELGWSQPLDLERIVERLPPMLPRVYRWVREMEEVGDFIEGKEGEIYKGFSGLFDRVEKSLEGDKADVDVLMKFVEDAEKMRHAQAARARLNLDSGMHYHVLDEKTQRPRSCQHRDRRPFSLSFIFSEIQGKERAQAEQSTAG
ncbi:6-phosphogluconate dehydrogenase C-terminal domain-like protein [Melanogaster broomeanus]|nr:6-phosphogluconate dehydrogenase C-terminal domain-like protein [Melanogaster broomeanus]